MTLFLTLAILALALIIFIFVLVFRTIPLTLLMIAIAHCAPLDVLAQSRRHKEGDRTFTSDENSGFVVI